MLHRLVKLAPLLKTSPIMAGGGGAAAGVEMITTSDVSWRVPTDHTATDEAKLVRPPCVIIIIARTSAQTHQVPSREREGVG